jgi:hypothetical protein
MLASSLSIFIEEQVQRQGDPLESDCLIPVEGPYVTERQHREGPVGGVQAGHTLGVF